MTRIVAIGDCHFGPGERNADRYAALDQIITESTALDGLGAWIQLGDLFHAKSTIDDRNAVAERLQRMAAIAPVLIVKGNHDAEGDLLIFARLQAAWPVYVVDRPAVLSVRLATGEMAAIACVPYPHKAGLIAAGTDASHTLETGREALTAIVRGLAAGLDVARQNGAIVLFAAHLNIGGAVTSVGQPSIGREIEADPAMLALLGDVPKLLGHIHLPQEIHGAHYAGSITCLDFGEVDDRKRFLVVEYEHKQTTAGEIRIWDVTSRPIQTPLAYHVEGELTRDGFTWRVTKGIGGEAVVAPASFAGSDVRVRYRFRPAQRDVLDEARVKAPFAGARILKLDPVPILDRAIRAPEVVAAASIEDKIRAYCAEAGIVVTDGLLAKLAALQAPVRAEGDLLEAAS